MKLKSAVAICRMTHDDLCKLVAKLQVDLAFTYASDKAKAKVIRGEVTRLLKPEAGP